jgi:hypothetical protein
LPLDIIRVTLTHLISCTDDSELDAQNKTLSQRWNTAFAEVLPQFSADLRAIVFGYLGVDGLEMNGRITYKGESKSDKGICACLKVEFNVC